MELPFSLFLFFIFDILSYPFSNQASFIGEELAQLPLGISNKGITGRPSPDSVQIRTQCLSVCVVQTAYANGASTAYLKEKGLKVEVRYYWHVFHCT